jgi:hypothetical protein
MKKVAYILLLVLFVAACKKKKSDTDEMIQTPPPSSAPTEFSVKTDGTEFSCSNCFSSFLSGGLRGVYFGGKTSGEDLFQFRFNVMPGVGIYTIIFGGNPAMTYVKNNTYYHITSGTLNITAVDTTTNGSIKKLIGTFSGKTDTTLSSQYPIFKLTDGVINLNR